MEKLFRKVRILSRKYSIKAISSLIRDLFSYLYLKYYGVDTKYGYVKIYGRPIIKKHPGSKIIIENGATIISKSKFNLAGINHRAIIATLSKNALIKIGKVGISGASICSVISITIDDYSGIGANTNIYDTDFHSINPLKRRNQSSVLDAKSGKISIGKDVWIGSNVTILKGVKIGDGAVIGTGSVVVKDLPGMAVYAGNPLTKIKSIQS